GGGGRVGEHVLWAAVENDPQSRIDPVVDVAGVGDGRHGAARGLELFLGLLEVGLGLLHTLLDLGELEQFTVVRILQFVGPLGQFVDVVGVVGIGMGDAGGPSDQQGGADRGGKQCPSTGTSGGKARRNGFHVCSGDGRKARSVDHGRRRAKGSRGDGKCLSGPYEVSTLQAYTLTHVVRGTSGDVFRRYP